MHRMLGSSIAFQTVDNEVVNLIKLHYHLIIYCSNFIPRDQNATYDLQALCLYMLMSQDS